MFIYNKLFNADIMIPVIVFFLGFMLLFSNYILQYKDFEKIDFTYKGEITLNENSITINQKEIKLIDITKFELEIKGYYEERINSMRHYSGRIPKEKNCLGVKNQIKITFNSQIQESFFELKSRTDKKNLELYLYKAIMNKSLINLPPKDSIKLIPKIYKPYKESKEYIAEFIKEGKITCKDGLLMIGYESDNEAKELRNKYCA